MTEATANASSAVAPSTDSPSLRLRRGWVGGCMDQKGVMLVRGTGIRECCTNGERAWLLTEGEAYLAATFDLATAQRIRDAMNGYAALQQVDELSARCCEEHPQSVEVGLFKGEELKHLIELDRSLATELLFALLESLEESMQTSAMSRDEVDRGFRRRVTERSLRLWRQADVSVTTHPMLQALRRVAPLTLTLELLLRDHCYGRSPEAFIGNLLVDVRHFCDAYQLDLGALDHRAHGDYLEERHSEGTRRQEAIPATTTPRLRVAKEVWKDLSECRDRSLLMTTVLIDGVSHHLKAIQVTTREGLQRTFDRKAEEELNDIHAACGATGPFETVTLEDREYVMTLTPHSR
jgi:hypothetical protein